MTTRFQALRDFGYGGARRLPGEVFDRQFLRNDERLMAEGRDTMRYLHVLTEQELRDNQLTHCDDCGRDFITEHFYDAHRPVVHVPPPPEPPPLTKIEQEYPGGLVLDPSGRPMRPARR